MWFLYEFLYVIGFVLYLPRALWRRRFPHRGWVMRLGRYPKALLQRLGGRQTLWVHAVSVGEVLAVLPLVEALGRADPDDPIVLSTITPGGFEVASRRLGERASVVYFPLDLSGCVARAFDQLRPRLLMLVESELWPTVIRTAHARGVPVAVVNGRISARTVRRYRWVGPWQTGMLRRVDAFLMQSQEDADRLLRLGAPADHVQVVGSLKWDASLSARPTAEAIGALAARIGCNGRQAVVVAGSTHRGEERVILDAFQHLCDTHPNLRLIIAPRHLERLTEVEALIRHAGYRSVRLSALGQGAAWDVGVVDSFGQLPVYYGLATVVFIGGSLIPHGGQNPLEAASLGKPVLFGPSMHNFSVISHQLLAHHAACQVSGPADLASLIGELLDQPQQAAEMGRRAQALTEQFQGATVRTLEALRPLLKGAVRWPDGYG